MDIVLDENQKQTTRYSIHKRLVKQITMKFLTHGDDPITSWEQTEDTFHCIFYAFLFSFSFQVGSTAFYFGEDLI